MKKNTQKINIVLVFAITLNLILVGLYVFAVNGIKKKSEETSATSAKLKDYLSKEGKLDKIKTAIKDTSDDRAKLESYFVNIDDIPIFTKKIESLSKASGVDSIIINSLSQKGDILMLNFTTKGKFENILYLVQLLKNIPFKIDIKKSYITKIKNNTSVVDKNRWQGLFSIEIIGFLNNQNTK